MITEAVVSASERGVPLVGMKLDYDLTILDTQSSRLVGRGPARTGLVAARCSTRWCSTATSIATARAAARWPPCAPTTASTIENAHDASADAIASAGVLLRPRRLLQGAARRRTVRPPPGADRMAPRMGGELRRVARSDKGMTPIDRRDYMWPVAAERYVGLRACRLRP